MTRRKTAIPLDPAAPVGFEPRGFGRRRTTMTTTRTTPLARDLLLIAAQGQHGRPCTPRSYIITGPNPNSRDDGYCEYYWSPAKWSMTFERWLRIAKLSKRYRRFCHYVEEILPRWQDVEEIHWADNSVDVVQRAADGRERRVQRTGPGGDRCY